MSRHFKSKLINEIPLDFSDEESSSENDSSDEECDKELHCFNDDGQHEKCCQRGQNEVKQEIHIHNMTINFASRPCTPPTFHLESPDE